MQIKIYVVKTEVDKDISLNALIHDAKLRILNEFGGLTVIPNCLGLWCDNSTVPTKGYIDICKDSVEIWEIYSDSPHTEELKRIVFDIKIATKQKSQLYTVNNDAIFV